LGTTTECAVRGSGTIGQMSIANRRFDASVICRSAFAVPKLADEELEEDLVPFSPVIVPGILLLVAIGFAVDLVLDRPSSWLSLHAARTSRSERTVRQHAVSIYQKSGLGGRAELAAFFLEGVRLNMKGTA
jgi:hypothetical protein